MGNWPLSASPSRGPGLTIVTVTCELRFWLVFHGHCHPRSRYCQVVPDRSASTFPSTGPVSSPSREFPRPHVSLLASEEFDGARVSSVLRFGGLVPSSTASSIVGTRKICFLFLTIVRTFCCRTRTLAYSVPSFHLVDPGPRPPRRSPHAMQVNPTPTTPPGTQAFHPHSHTPPPPPVRVSTYVSMYGVPLLHRKWAPFRVPRLTIGRLVYFPSSLGGGRFDVCWLAERSSNRRMMVRVIHSGDSGIVCVCDSAGVWTP